MKTLAKSAVLSVAAALLSWHGVLLATPHDHADNTVPREELACSASHPSSQASHVHHTGRLLSHHSCLACLAGTTIAEAPGTGCVESITIDGVATLAASPDLRSRFHAELPLLRGPPRSA